MSLQNLLNQFIGTGNASSTTSPTDGGLGDTFGKLSSNIPDGLAGGAAAGGVMALLMSNKSARKFAGKAATYGGAAMLGGLALKAYQNWQQNGDSQGDAPNNFDSNQSVSAQQHAAITQASQTESFELTIMKAMIAAAKSDGHIDADEQQRIFKAVENMDLSTADKGVVFDCLSKDISINELASAVPSLEMKSEVYLASCLVIELDNPLERAHLDQLSAAMGLPKDLASQLESQAQQAFSTAT